MGKKQQRIFFKKQINLGILKANIEEAGKQNPQFETIRKTKNPMKPNDIVMCSDCNIFIKKTGMGAHKRHCNPTVFYVHPKLLSTPDTQTSDEYKAHVLATLRNDDAGILCKTDPTILTYGYWKFQKTRHNDNKIGTRESVRKNMRFLANLFCHFKRCFPGNVELNCRDMFNSENFYSLLESLDTYCSEGDNLKAGLKHGVQYALISAANILKAVAFTNNQEKEAAMYGKFLDVFKLWEGSVFGDAAAKLKKTSETKARKPEELPVEEDVRKLRNHTISIIKDFVSSPDDSKYIRVRNSICARLTFFNGRRGGEPARLLLSDLDNAFSDAWIDNNFLKSLDELDRLLIKKLKVTYQSGKGNKLVPLLFPEDVISALKLLVDKGMRERCHVSKTNKFVFPSTKNSEAHISGWHCIHDICTELNLNSMSKITATKNRHRMSTLYASMEMSEGEKKAFFSHMGHSETMSQTRYQCPPAISEVTKVGRFFSNVDTGNYVFNQILILIKHLQCSKVD